PPTLLAGADEVIEYTPNARCEWRKRLSMTSMLNFGTARPEPTLSKPQLQARSRRNYHVRLCWKHDQRTAVKPPPLSSSPATSAKHLCRERLRRILSLLRQQRIGAVPVFRRRGLDVAANADFVEPVERGQRLAVVALAAALDGGERAFPVAAAVAGQHLDGEVAQALEAARLRDVLAAGDGVDHLGLLLALHHDEVEFEDGEFFLHRHRRLRADDDRKAVFLALAFEAGCEIDAVAVHRIVEPQVGPHVADHHGSGVEADADIERNVGVAAFPGLLLARPFQRVAALQHVDRSLAGVDLMLLVV